MNFLRAFKLFLILILAVPASTVFAISQTVDQSYLPGPNFETAIGGIDYTTGQAFKPSLNRLTRIDVSLNKAAGDDSQVNLILTDATNAFLAETHRVAGSGLNYFTFASPIQVTPEKTYRFFLSEPSGNYSWRGVNPGGYTRGYSIINGNPDSGKDFLFRSWGYHISQSSPSDPSVLEPPTNLEASDIPGDQGKAIKLNWTSTTTTSYDGYNVYRAEKIDGDTSGIRSWLLVGKAGFGKKEFTDEKDLYPTRTYYYVVRTYKGSYESEDSNEVEISPVDHVPPDAPFNLKIISSGKGWVELSWEAVTAEDLDGYEVHYGKKSTDLNQTEEVPKDKTKITIESLSRGTEYFFVIKAKDTSGNLSSASNRASQYIEGINWLWYLLIILVVAAGAGVYFYFAFKKRWWPFNKKNKNIDKKSGNSIIKNNNPEVYMAELSQAKSVEASGEGEEKKIGEVTHYFGKIGVGIIKLSDSLKVGSKIKIKGATTDFEQEVSSIQVNHEDIEEAKSGDEVGIKLDDKVREGDEVFTVTG